MVNLFREKNNPGAIGSKFGMWLRLGFRVLQALISSETAELESLRFPLRTQSSGQAHQQAGQSPLDPG
jgi:hypothetical protein